MGKQCSSDQEKLLKFEAEEIANFLRSVQQFIQTVKGQKFFCNITLISGGFLRSTELEHLQFRFEKNSNIWGLETCKKKSIIHI